MKTYLSKDNCWRTFRDKPPKMQKLINEALQIIEACGIPLEGFSPRGLEKMALAFLAVAQVDASTGWAMAKDSSDGVSLKSRDIINFINEKFGENISSGSYDDIRRKDLKLPVADGLVARSKPNAPQNDPERGYCLDPKHAQLVRSFGTDQWESLLSERTSGHETLAARIRRERDLSEIPITIAARELNFSPGEHNELQKAIIEVFLPRYGYGAEVLYVGDTQEKFLFLESSKLEALGIPNLGPTELPDILAYTKQRNWLYVIEAVHSSGPISPVRHLQLEEMMKESSASAIYVTAFLSKNIFKKWVTHISWETEVWIADHPDHLIHFDGEKFLGPYGNREAE